MAYTKWPTPFIFGQRLHWFHVDPDDEYRIPHSRVSLVIRRGNKVIVNAHNQTGLIGINAIGHVFKSAQADLNRMVLDNLMAYLTLGGGARSVQCYQVAYLIYDGDKFVDWMETQGRSFVAAPWKKKYKPGKVPVGYYAENGVILKDDAHQHGNPRFVPVFELARQLGDIEADADDYYKLLIEGTLYT